MGVVSDWIHRACRGLMPTIDELMREAVLADLPGGHRCHRAPRGFCATAVE